MGEDLEIRAMSTVLGALEPLDNDGRARVVDWAVQKLSIVGTRSVRKSAQNETDEKFKPNGEFVEFHDLFDAANPETDIDKALVEGYWFQVCRGEADFSGQQINDDLKQLGHPVGNITRAFDNLQAHKPVLARQVQKSGKNKQGRKKYKLTREGEARVQQMMRR